MNSTLCPLYGRFAPLPPVFCSFFTSIALMSVACAGLKHVPTIVGLMNVTNGDSAKRFHALICASHRRDAK
ncbi:hypothetical protein [Arcanobacterium ihumii]|uniref:hypothetical protein n=1 Tax=Arcanobacterium ihumii TaxID=2138162 RepID=UPI000F523A08|nr:hypothetical protein [Arcanobacterium ihumii]